MTDSRVLTSVDKALALLETLAEEPEGLALGALALRAQLAAPTAHRLLRVLRRRGFVHQDADTGKYALTLKVLDLSFRYLKRSELRLHAYPALRAFASRTSARTFVAASADGEVTYVWGAPDDGRSMYTAYGKPMPSHCSMFFADGQARRLSCARLCAAADVTRSRDVVVRLGDDEDGKSPLRLNCACAPVRDYSGHEVARVGVFSHGEAEDALHDSHARAAWDLARATSLRLGHLTHEADPGRPLPEDSWPT